MKRKAIFLLFRNNIILTLRGWKNGNGTQSETTSFFIAEEKLFGYKNKNMKQNFKEVIKNTENFENYVF